VVRLNPNSSRSNGRDGGTFPTCSAPTTPHSKANATTPLRVFEVVSCSWIFNMLSRAT
jgi:hypothetical protein